MSAAQLRVSSCGTNSRISCTCASEIRSNSVSAVSSRSMSTTAWPTIEPESAVSSTISNSVTPVRASPERIAHGIAARPRWRGRRVGCMPNTPSRASARNGERTSCDQPTTKISSGSSAPIASSVSSSLMSVVSIKHRSARLGDLVERTLAGAVRIDGARKRDDSDDLSARAASGLEARPADRVEAHPDRAHLSAMLSSYSTADGALASRPRWIRIQLCRARKHEQRCKSRGERDDDDHSCARDVEQLHAREAEHSGQEEPEELLGDGERQAPADQARPVSTRAGARRAVRSRCSRPPSAQRLRRRGAPLRGRCPFRRPCAP